MCPLANLHRGPRGKGSRRWFRIGPKGLGLQVLGKDLPVAGLEARLCALVPRASDAERELRDRLQLIFPTFLFGVECVVRTLE